MTLLKCSFCGKTQDQCTFMVQGPNEVAICNECIDLFFEEKELARRRKEANT